MSILFICLQPHMWPFNFGLLSHLCYMNYIYSTNILTHQSFPNVSDYLIPNHLCTFVHSLARTYHHWTLLLYIQTLVTIQPQHHILQLHWRWESIASFHSLGIERVNNLIEVQWCVFRINSNCHSYSIDRFGFVNTDMLCFTWKIGKGVWGLVLCLLGI